VAGSCEYGNESSGSVNCGEFLDQLRDFTFSVKSVLRGISQSLTHSASMGTIQYDCVC
jgi:hypothetical protein